MTNLSLWIFKMSSCGLNAGMETSAPRFNAVVNNDLFHGNSHINLMLLQIIPIICFCPVDSCTRFCCQLDWGQGCSAATNLEVYEGDHYLLDYCTFGLEAANTQNVRVDTDYGKDHGQQNLSKWKSAQRCKHCTLAVVRLSQKKKFRPAADPFSGDTGRPKFNQLEMVTIPLPTIKTQFGEDRCTQFRVIVVTDPQTHAARHRQDR